MNNTVKALMIAGTFLQSGAVFADDSNPSSGQSPSTSMKIRVATGKMTGFESLDVLGAGCTGKTSIQANGAADCTIDFDGQIITIANPTQTIFCEYTLTFEGSNPILKHTGGNNCEKIIPSGPESVISYGKDFITINVP